MRKYLKPILGEYNLELLMSLFKSKREQELSKRRLGFYSQFLDFSEDIYFDVGSNYGNRIEPLINEGGKIIAVEPQPNCIKFLKRKFGNKITIVEKGLGELQTSRKMYISNASTLSSFSKDFIEATQKSGRFKNYTWNKEIGVEITTLDELIKSYGKPKFIKIDVEGYEYQVLQGLSQNIDFISFEYCVEIPQKLGQ